MSTSTRIWITRPSESVENGVAEVLTAAAHALSQTDESLKPGAQHQVFVSALAPGAEAIPVAVLDGYGMLPGVAVKALTTVKALAMPSAFSVWPLARVAEVVSLAPVYAAAAEDRDVEHIVIGDLAAVPSLALGVPHPGNVRYLAHAGGGLDAFETADLFRGILRSHFGTDVRADVRAAKA